MTEYKFDPASAFEVIKKDLLSFTEKLGTKKVVLGISGGKDSTITAKQCAKILGPENVSGACSCCTSSYNGNIKTFSGGRHDGHDDYSCCILLFHICMLFIASIVFWLAVFSAILSSTSAIFFLLTTVAAFQIHQQLSAAV